MNAPDTPLTSDNDRQLCENENGRRDATNVTDGLTHHSPLTRRRAVVSVSPDTRELTPATFLTTALSVLDRLPFMASREAVAEAVAVALWQAHESGYTAGRGDTLAEGNEHWNAALAHAVDLAVNR